jgi:enoyl-CoA hydratase/carnithine racemase
MEGLRMSGSEDAVDGGGIDGLVEIDRGGEIPVGVAVIRLNHPPVNVLSVAVAARLSAVADVLGADGSVRAIVLYGGERAFAAGADVKEFERMDQAALARDGLALERAVAKIAALPKPVIAAVTGYALGGGCELAMAADIRISADTAQWGQPEILLGLMPGAGGTQRLPRLIGPAAAKDLIFSGRFVAGPEAKELGLADIVVPVGEVLGAALELAGSYATRPATALAASKAAIDRGIGADLDTGLLLERAYFAGLFSTADKISGVRSFIEEGPGKAVFPPPA